MYTRFLFLFALLSQTGPPKCSLPVCDEITMAFITCPHTFLQLLRVISYSARLPFNTKHHCFACSSCLISRPLNPVNALFSVPNRQLLFPSVNAPILLFYLSHTLLLFRLREKAHCSKHKIIRFTSASKLVVSLFSKQLSYNMKVA